MEPLFAIIILLAIVLLLILLHKITSNKSIARTPNNLSVLPNVAKRDCPQVLPPLKPVNEVFVVGNKIASGCYFFTGANGTRLYGYNDPNSGIIIQLGTNPGPAYPYGSTKWYYDNLQGIIYATDDSAGLGVSGFLAPATAPQGVAPSLLTIIPGNTISSQATGWQLISTDNNGGVQIQYSNPAAVPPLSYVLNTAPNGTVQLVSYASSYPTDSSATFSAVRVGTDTQDCIQCTAQAAPWINCENGARKGQEDCNNNCLNDPDAGACTAGCAVAASVVYAVCNNQYPQIDCTQLCIPCVIPGY